MSSLSQRYRPQRFADVTGQQHVTETLRKEVETGKLGHAFLFCGPRGVGKTTSARIFAKALNCAAPVSGEPCGSCTSCQAFEEHRVMDIIELDAATHTGVETIREAIIEHVRFSPAGKRKVYILDEAHMLSTSSWNALLKTLEEPPAYAFFILATTEWHKVPATIVSRCQRFEFRRISDADLFARLQALALAEKWEVEEAVLKLIVSRAEGCVRDAETLLGQIGSLANGPITLEIAGLVVPLNQLVLATQLMAHWAKKEHVAALTVLQEWNEQGIPLVPLLDDCLLVIKKLLHATARPSLKEQWQQGVADERAMVPLIDAWSPSQLNDLALILLERRRDLKAGLDPLFAFQLASTMAVFQLNRDVATPMGTSVSGNASVPATSVPSVLPPPTAPPVVAPLAPAPVAIPAAEMVKPITQPISPVVAAPVSATASAVPSSGSVSSSGLDLATVRLKWNAFIRAVEEQNHSLPFVLKISKPESVINDQLVIRFQYPFHKDKVIDDPKHFRVISECARLAFGAPHLQITGVVGEMEGPAKTASTDVVGNILKTFGGSVMET